MVDILKSNFLERLPEIESSIRKSCFISFDSEFTGLIASPDCDYNLFDSMQGCYTKLRKSATSFIPCQIGLTTYSRVEGENIYTAKTFTFYLRPHQFGQVDRRFLLQASALDFLNLFKFDFNKFAVEGIPYLNEAEETIAKKAIEDGSLWTYHIGQLGEDVKRKQEIFLSQWLSTAKYGDKTTLQLDKVGHEYFHLYYLRKKFSLLWAVAENNRVLVQKVKPEKRKELEGTIEDEEEKVLQFFIGFSHVLKILKEAKKPFIGHNVLFDLLLMYHNFYKPLPKKYNQFIKELHNLFPVIYDTKHIWLNAKRVYDIGHIQYSSALYDLYDMLKSPPNNLKTLYCPGINRVNCEKYATEYSAHDAGFDSYVTGFVFINLCHIFASKLCTSLAYVSPQSTKQHLKAISPFQNKINVARARLHYIDLLQDDSHSHRPDFLYVRIKKGIGPLSAEEVLHRLSLYGHVEIQPLNSTEMLVAVGSYGCADRILNALNEDDSLEADRYSALHHSPVVKIGIRATCIVAGLLGIVLFFRSCSTSTPDL